MTSRPFVSRFLVGTCSLAIALLLMGAGLFLSLPVHAAQLQLRTLQLSNNIPGQTAQYTVSMNVPSAGTLGSIKVEFCANSAILYMACTAPVGFDVSGATIATQSGTADLVIDPSTTANVLVLSRPPSVFAGGPLSVTLDGVINTTTQASSFARYYTYATNDASGPVTDDGAVAYMLNDDFTVNAEVPPYLTLCVGVSIPAADCSVVEGDFVGLGELGVSKSSTGQSQVSLATNAANGYTVRVVGSTMTSGNNVIPALNTPTLSSVGTSQFGINLRANASPAVGADPAGSGTGNPTADYAQPNRFKYVSGDILASNSGPTDFRKFTISYLVNISRTQPVGVYSSTFSYVALGNF